jgi:sugar/nucleoside kinase (ribokinase family)
MILVCGEALVDSVKNPDGTQQLMPGGGPFNTAIQRCVPAWLHDNDRIDGILSLETEELRATLEFACLAASLTCARAGAEPPTRSEMERAEAARH